MALNADYYRTIFDYGYWARDRLYTAMEGMTDEEYAKPNGFTYNGLRSMLTHTLGAEQIWLTRFLGEQPGPFLNEESLPGLADLKATWEKEEARMRQFLASTSDAALEADVVTRMRNGNELRLPLWVLLTQVSNHGTQHRSEAAEALTLIGRSPGGLDFMNYYRERNT